MGYSTNEELVIARDTKKIVDELLIKGEEINAEFPFKSVTGDQGLNPIVIIAAVVAVLLVVFPSCLAENFQRTSLPTTKAILRKTAVPPTTVRKTESIK